MLARARPAAGLAAALAAAAALGDPRAARAAESQQGRRRAGAPGAPPCVVFMGTGTSSVNPHLNCVLGLQPQLFEVGGCHTCKKALNDGPPEVNKNVRGNPSMLICFDADIADSDRAASRDADDHEDDEEEDEGERPDAEVGGDSDLRRFVQIDCGKTFRSSALTWYPRHGIPRLDAVVVTHEHADAVFGIDDLRLVAKPGHPVEVYTSLQTYEMIARAFPYLVREPHPEYVGAVAHLAPESASPSESSSEEITTFIATLKYKIMSTPSLEDSFTPFNVAGLEMTPLPVFHGPNYLSLGFAFGKTNKKFVYISDVSEIPPKVMAKLREWDIEYLVLDTLHKKRQYPTHLSLEQSLAIVEDLRPAKTFLIGVSHNFEHHKDNEALAKLKEEKGLDVEIPHDGLRVDLDNIVL